jgi:hypothetical protein
MAHPEPLVLTDDGFLEIDWRRVPLQGEGPAILLAEELYLRELLELDLDDQRAVAAFCSAYGRLSGRALGAEPAVRNEWPLLPRGYVLGEETDAQGSPAHRAELAEIELLVADYAKRRRAYPPPRPGFVRASDPLAPGSYDETPQMRSFTHVREEIIYARCLRNAVRFWDALGGNRSLFLTLSREWEGDMPTWITRGLPVMPDRSQIVAEDVFRHPAIVYVRDILNAGLQPFHVHVDVLDPRYADTTGSYWQAGTYSLLCLQFANDVAGQAHFARCANESCGRLFVRQRGRALKGQNRKDAIYCDKHCAKAQAQRQYRRRQAAGQDETP